MVLVWIATFVWTAPIGLAWHLFHGNFAPFEGRKVPVPPDMWASRSDGGGLIIMREAPKYPLFHSPSAIMLLSLGRGSGRDLSKEKEYDKISRIYAAPQRDGYRLREVRRVSGVDRMGYCWELSRADSSYITCLFDKSSLGVTFDGSTEYRDKFYSVVTVLTGHSSKRSD